MISVESLNFQVIVPVEIWCKPVSNFEGDVYQLWKKVIIDLRTHKDLTVSSTFRARFVTEWIWHASLSYNLSSKIRDKYLFKSFTNVKLRHLALINVPIWIWLLLYSAWQDTDTCSIFGNLSVFCKKIFMLIQAVCMHCSVCNNERFPSEVSEPE